MAYPKQIFTIMVLLLLGSAFFTLSTAKRAGTKPNSRVSPAMTKPVGKGLSQLISGAAELYECIRLKEEITEMLAKDALSPADSIRMEKAIQRLHQLTIKTNPNGQH